MKRSQIPAIVGRPYERDSSRAKTVLLVNFNGQEGQSTATDIATGKVVTLTETTFARIVRRHSRWGLGTLYMGGGSNRVTTPSSADFDFGTGDFQIRINAALSTPASTYEVMANRTNADGNNFWLFRLSSSGTLRLYNKVGGVVNCDITTTGGVTINDGIYHDIEIRRVNQIASIWYDGKQCPVSTTANTTGAWTNPGPLILGNGDDNYTDGAIGYFAWWRVKKGVAPPPEYRVFPPAGQYPIPAY